jgi:hypothetical protein
LFSTIGAFRAFFLAPMAVKSKPPDLRMAVDSKDELKAE